MQRSLFALLLVLVSCEKKAPEPPAAPAPAPAAAAQAPAGPVVVEAAMLEVFKPVPARFDSDKNPATDDKIALGRMLYFDARLSKNQDVSCNSCHDLAAFGVDGKKLSLGHRGQLGGRNSPTVYNAGGHIAQFWDGRAADLEEQAKGPILNPVEMAMPSAEQVVKVVRSIPGYVAAFKKAFPKDKDPVTYDNLAAAIGAFERGLTTPSRFDRYLAGDKGALTEQEQRGLVKFVQLGCPTCHNGPAVGGSSFQRLGLVNPYPDQSDLGRFGVTKQDADRMVFRVPSLRNVEKTGPWFHNGSLTALPVVVRTMARHQLGKEITDEEAELVATFLRSLTGTPPAGYIGKPELPPSGPKTPKPDPS